MARPLPVGSAPLSPASESLPGAAPQLPQKGPVSPCLSTGHRENQSEGFCGKWSDSEARHRATAAPGEESDCPHAVKMQFAERKPLRPHAPNCSVRAALESPPPHESRQPPLAGKFIFYKSHNGPLAFNQVLGVGNSLPVGQTLRRKQLAPNIQGRWGVESRVRSELRSWSSPVQCSQLPRVDEPLAELQGAALIYLFLRHRQRQGPCFMFPCRKVIKCPGAAGNHSPINSKGKAIFLCLGSL